MRIVLAGGSGFLGRALQARLRSDGHQVLVLTRRPPSEATDMRAWNPNGTVGDWATGLDGADAIINLAGEGIAEARWTTARKEALRASRVLSTRSLVAALEHVPRRPAVFVTASAVGYYGDRGSAVVTESTPAGSDFLSRLCVEWESEATHASRLTRLVLLRTGFPLHPSGGLLRNMLLPFRLGLGGPIGSGTQYVPWIHLDDWVEFVMRTIASPDARGAFNVTAPAPVTNAELTRALGRVLHRPAFIPVPRVALRLVLGELSNALLTGQRAIPDRAAELEFAFRFVTVEDALHDLLGQVRPEVRH